MVKRGTALPKKLTHDAIVEAVLELRFETQVIPEVLLGRLVDHPNWKSFQRRQLPAYNIPAQIRLVDPNVRYAPIIELVGTDTKAALRIGPSVVSYHRVAPYVGWESFKPELMRVVESLFATAEGISIKRIGFRYLNSLRPSLHYISSVADLDIKLTVSEGDVSSNLNINFTTNVGNGSSCTVRIATKEFVQGGLPHDTSVFVDVDVFTNEGFKTSDVGLVKEWVEFAHTKEKDEFFHLFKQPTIDKLKEE